MEYHYSRGSCVYFMDLFRNILCFLRGILFSVLCYGPMPSHVAFIMDGNRRFSKKRKLKQGGGHRAGYSALVSTLQYCYEMGIKYVTVYAFSIDNFKRKPEEVDDMMCLMMEKIEEFLKQGSIISRYSVRICFWGNLKLLKEPVRLAVEKAMSSTAGNTGPVLSICVAYTSTDEITHAMNLACIERHQNLHGSCKKETFDAISVDDIEKHLFTDGCPNPDIAIRTSGETRLSNFLLWQTTFCHLQNPFALWPEFTLWHLIWAILKYQKVHHFLETRKKSGWAI